MILIPAVDIQEGKCTQLVGGKPGTEKYYGDPLEIAKSWVGKGAQILHVIDLDAALGDSNNLDMVKEIALTVEAPVQFGGGIRSLGYARDVLDAGIERVIIGSLAVKDPASIKELSEEYGRERVMAAVDSSKGKVVVKGWTESTGMDTIELIRELEDYVFGFLLTDVDREGKMEGIDISEFKEIASKTSARICASGGITTKDDVEALDGIGIWGGVVGRALYEGRISL